MVENSKPPKKGIFRDYGESVAITLELYKQKKTECPTGVNLLKEQDKVSGKDYLRLREADPITDKRVMRKCGEDFTLEGIVKAVEKAHEVAAALKTITPNEFWSWYPE